MYSMFGAKIKENGIEFTFVFYGENPKVNIYNKKSKELVKTLIPNPSDIRGRVCSLFVPEINHRDVVYLYEYDGKEHMDPYARMIVGRDTWGKKEKLYCAVVKSDKPLECKKNDVSEFVLYRLHMRGFTMDKKISSGSKGNFKGIIGSIPYFKKLGINALEFFPLYDFNEDLGDKTDFWGYGGKGTYFMAPKASYFEGDLNNAVSMVNTLHNSGISVIIDFCFNKNYLLSDELILSAVRFWAFEIGVDGFRFIGDGVPVHLIKSDPFLSDKIMIFEEPGDMSEDKGKVLIQNDGFLYTIRKFINHVETGVPSVCGLMRRQEVNSFFVNYVSAPNGFSLWDSFSYREKHNEQNGEDNKDGNNVNYSDNCGVEGDTKDKSVIYTRLCKIRSSILLLMMSQGLPLINAGDELLNSQGGNNNPYCQDNKLGWVNFSRKKDALALQEYLGKLISFRKSHSAIYNPLPYRMSDYKKVGIPDISYHSKEPWVSYLDESKRSVGILISGDYSDSAHEDVMILINFHNTKEQFTLPVISGKKWYQITNTLDFEFDDKGKRVNEKKAVNVPADSITLLVAR